MAAEIESARPDAAIELHGEDDAPGTFNVVADGTQLWSKHETGSFPEPGVVVGLMPPPNEKAPSS